MKSKQKIIVLFFVSWMGVFRVMAQDEGVAIYNSVTQSILAIQTFNAENIPIAQATAFIADTSGIIVTNAHVLEGGVFFKVSIPSGRILPVTQILAIDHLHDLAFLIVRELDSPAVVLGNSEAVVIGERVFAVGNPRGLENTISNGVLSGIRKFSGQGAMLQTTAPVSKGSSGGVLVNVRGEVIGVTTFIVGGGQNLNFAVPINIVAKKLQEIGPVPPQQPSTKQALSDKPRILDKPLQIQSGQHSLYLLMNIAYSAFRAKDYEVARQSFTKALKIDSTETEAMKGLAQTVYALGDFQEALLLYKRITDVDSTDAKAYYNGGVTASRLDSNEIALQMYENAVRLDSQHFDAWFEIGVLQGQRRDYQQALQAFKKAHSVNPSHWQALYYMGVTADAMGDHENAIVWLQQASELNPDNFDVWFKLGMAHYGAGQHSTADSVFAQAVSLNPKHGPSWLWRGIMANLAKDAVRAREYADRARPFLSDKMDKLNCFLLLADTHLQTGDTDKALNELQQANAIETGDLRVHELLARAYLAKGDYKKANEEYTIIEQLKQSTVNKK